MKLARLWPLAAALLVAIAAIPPGCSSEQSVPWAASTQPHAPRAAVPPPTTRPRGVTPPPRAVAAAPAAPQANAATVPPRAATRPARPATTTTSTGEVVRTVRVFCDSNPTPIFQPNPRYQGVDRRGPDAAGNEPWIRQNDCYSTLLKLGARPAFVLYIGTMNRARTWCDDQWNPKPMPIGRYGGMGIDWSREGNYTDPPEPRAIRACARLAMDPMFYRDDSYPAGPRPMMIDIEATKSVNLVGIQPTVENRRASIRHMIECIRAAKAGSQGKCEVWGYGWIPQAMYYPKAELPTYEKTRDLERELANEVSGVCLSLYNWDKPVQTGGESWWEDLNSVQAIIDKDFPEFNNRKVVLVHPRWSVIWPDKLPPEQAAMDGKAIPLALWKRQIDTLVKGGWELFIWIGPTLGDDVMEHFEYACRFAK